MRGRFVRLVDDEDVAQFNGLHERRVLVNDFAVPDHRLQGESLHGRVAVQLYVLARPVQQLQQPVHDLVLADTLIADQQEILPQAEVLQQPLQERDVFRDVVEHDVGYFTGHRGAIPVHDGVADPHGVLRDRVLDHRIRRGLRRNDVEATAGLLECLLRDRRQEARQTRALYRVVSVVAPKSMYPLGDSQELPSAQ